MAAVKNGLILPKVKVSEMPTNSATLQTRNVWALCLIMYEYSVAQLGLALCVALDCSPPGSSINEIFQARILEWIAISFPGGSS